MTLSFSVEQNGLFDERAAIVVVDRHPLPRSCLARILRNEFQDFTVLEIETVHQFDSIIGKNISLVALNIGSSAMTDECVLQNLAYVRRSLAEGPLILLTKLDESMISDAMISEVTHYGVRGYITASASVEIALAALRLVIAGGAYFPRAVVVDCPNWTPVSSDNIVALQPAMPMSDAAPEMCAITKKTNVAFTERERQVLATLLRGLPNKVIASELNLSPNTVKSHISRIMQKLHAKNRTEAVVLSQHAG
ncbi:response regulator transcription factor [Allomesorhizobium camelthorni]|nr:response regulator transcription factor [Mesorhizobium camelthorni]